MFRLSLLLKNNRFGIISWTITLALVASMVGVALKWRESTSVIPALALEPTAAPDENPPESVTLIVEGKGGAGFVKGTGYVKFDDLGDQTTMLHYTGEANIGGTLASVGQRMIDSVAKSMIKSGCDKLQKTLEARCQQK